jgi:hypothetical protein
MESDIATNASNISTNDTDISNLQSDKYDKTGGTISGSVTVTGDLSATNLGGTLSTAAQPNVTSVGTLSSLAVSADAAINSLTVGRGAGNISSNTALGSGALSSNTTASNNTAIGFQALLDNTTGVNNTAVGLNALSSNTTANNNTASGVSALLSNTTGADNTASGLSALRNNDTGSNNTASGASALFSNTTGVSNTASGMSALRLNTTGTKNIGIGFGAGDAITTGSNNTIIGDIAGTADLQSTIILAAGTTERMRINSTGNVGIGTSSPSSNLGFTRNLTIAGSSASIVLDDTDASAYEIASSSNQFRIFNNTTERFRINELGNVGIGTGSPDSNARLHVVGGRSYFDASNEFTLRLSQSGTIGGFIGTPASGVLGFYSSAGTERMRIDSSGNVGIGVTPSGDKLDVYGNIKIGTTANSNILNRSESHWIQYNGGATANDTFVRVASINAASIGRTISFHTNSAERMRIDSNGNVLIGTTSTLPSKGIAMLVDTTSGIVRVATNTTSADALCEFFNPNGKVGQIVTTGTATSYVTSSDYRLKENVVPMEGALDRVDALKPSRFNFITDPETTVDGFLAHQVAEVIPEAITGEKDAVDEEGNPIYQGIDQSKIVPLLVGAIKELSAKVAALESQLNAQ